MTVLRLVRSMRARTAVPGTKDRCVCVNRQTNASSLMATVAARTKVVSMSTLITVVAFLNSRWKW